MLLDVARVLALSSLNLLYDPASGSTTLDGNNLTTLSVEFIIFDKGYRCIVAAMLTQDVIARSRVRKRNNVTMC